jgi:hypothetical protein
MQGQFATTLKNTLKGDNITLRSRLIENDGKRMIRIPDGNDMVIRNHVLETR